MRTISIIFQAYWSVYSQNMTISRAKYFISQNEFDEMNVFIANMNTN